MKKLAVLLFLVTVLAVQFTTPVLAGPVEDVQVAMQLLKSKATTLGTPSVKGEETVAGKTVPTLYFGETKMNNNFALVDEVQKEKGGTVASRKWLEFDVTRSPRT